MDGSILIKGARLHNLKNVTLAIPKDRLVASPASPAPASPRSPSTCSTGKASGSTWSRWAWSPTPASPSSTRSRACRRRSASTSISPTAARGRRSARPPRSSPTCACCWRGSGTAPAGVRAGRPALLPGGRRARRGAGGRAGGAVPALRDGRARAGHGELLVQQARGRLPDLHRPRRRAAGGRAPAGRPGAASPGGAVSLAALTVIVAAPPTRPRRSASAGAAPRTRPTAGCCSATPWCWRPCWSPAR
jgi:hypothetical protein